MKIKHLLVPADGIAVRRAAEALADALAEYDSAESAGRGEQWQVQAAMPGLASTFSQAYAKIAEGELALVSTELIETLRARGVADPKFAADQSWPVMELERLVHSAIAWRRLNCRSAVLAARAAPRILEALFNSNFLIFFPQAVMHDGRLEPLIQK